MRITEVHARQIVDCKTRPLVEVDVLTEDGHLGRGASPTGQSVGMWEATVLRDGDPSTWDGLSVHRAVANVEGEIAQAIVGMDVEDTEAVDRRMIELDGTSRKSRLGGNAIYSTSIAVARAAAAVQGVPLYQRIAGRPLSTVPVPSFNMINGGRHDDIVQSFNEFIVMPYRAESIQEAVEISIRLFGCLGRLLEEKLGHNPGVAPSYGYQAPSSDPRIVLSLMRDAMDRIGLADKFAFALDCASSEFYDQDKKTYIYAGRPVDAEELIGRVADLTSEFDFVFIEDLLDENDWEHWPTAVARLPRTIIIGDDLVVTNRDRLARAVELNAVGGFILKPNQVGTLTEAFETYHEATRHGLLAIPSGRSGGVVDDVVMDLSVGLQVPFQKNGAPRSGERIEKLNFLIRASESAPGITLADVPALVRF
jgi:enolase